ncbi:MAG: hypothetical protein OQJ81_12335, partial [Melioribacteraceae bacterium]|nr:hypothetical protein [Melioribacteraceae bacterium]
MIKTKKATEKKQITKLKKQKTNNLHREKNKTQTFLGFVKLMVWHLFGIYSLKFGISNYAKLSLIALPILFFGGCYSFTGSSVPSHLKTIYIPFCIDNTGSGEPTLADDFTSKLIDQF